MSSMAHTDWTALSRRALLASAIAVVPIGVASAEVKDLELIAPAGPGGGYDQLARASHEVLQAKQLATGVQVQSIPGAGGTIGLTQFVTKGSRRPNLLVAELGMIGAIAINKSPVTLDQVAPLARLTGEYQPLRPPRSSLHSWGRSGRGSKGYCGISA